MKVQNYNLSQKHFLVLGAGSMAQSIIKGILKARLLPANHITVTNRSNQERLKQLVHQYGVQKAQETYRIESADVIFLMMKPQDASQALLGISEFLHPGQLVISVAAGISTLLLESIIEKEVAVIRAMPNTACAVQSSATAIALGTYVNQYDLAIATSIFSAVGSVEVVEEEMMNAVTGLSGTGPAYFYYMVEGLVDAGISIGLEENVARSLVLQTLKGAAEMLLQTDLEPAELRRQVTSPNGTTMAAISLLEQGNFLELIQQAVQRATGRSREMEQSLIASSGTF